MMKNVDLTYLNEISGGDKNFIREMLELFVNTTSEEVNQFDALVSSNMYDQIGALAHKMKAPIQMLGANTLFENIRNLERCGKEKSNLAEIPNMVEGIKMQVAELTNEIKELLKTY